MPSKKRAHKKRRAELKKQARAPGTQKGYLCCSDQSGEKSFSVCVFMIGLDQEN